jgi:predicted DNA-binding transcriptional regulator YafY
MSTMECYIGQTIEVIYLDREGRFTQRIIMVREVEGGWVSAYCYARGAPRRFRLDHILAVRAVPQPRLYRGVSGLRSAGKNIPRTAG